MKTGPNLLTLEQIGTYSAQYERKEISEEQFLAYKKDACPGLVEPVHLWEQPPQCR